MKIKLKLKQGLRNRFSRTLFQKSPGYFGIYVKIVVMKRYLTKYIQEKRLNSTLSCKVLQEMIAKLVGLDRSVISRNVQNTKISDMHNLLSQGHDMDYIARHYHMDLALARPPQKKTPIIESQYLITTGY